MRFTATGRHPFVRFVGDPEVVKNEAALDAWATVVARWIAEGREPYFSRIIRTTGMRRNWDDDSSGCCTRGLLTA